MIALAGRTLKAAFLAGLVIFLLAPIVVVIGTALTPTDYILFPPPGLSLRWFFAIADNQEFVSAFELSLMVGLGSSALATVLGGMAALAIQRHSFPGRGFVLQLATTPLVVPGVVLGIGLLQLYAAFGLSGHSAALVLAHVVICLPYVVRLVLASLAGTDPALERAAANLGASTARTFVRVTFPSMRTGVLAAAVFAFITSFDDTSLAIFLVTSGSATLPVQIYNYVSFNFNPLITAVGSVMVLIAVITVVVIEHLVGLGRAFGVQESRAAVH